MTVITCHEVVSRCLINVMFIVQVRETWQRVGTKSNQNANRLHNTNTTMWQTRRSDPLTSRQALVEESVKLSATMLYEITLSK